MKLILAVVLGLLLLAGCGSDDTPPAVDPCVAELAEFAERVAALDAQPDPVDMAEWEAAMDERDILMVERADLMDRCGRKDTNSW